ncbi:hypothetical protein N7522_000516 [Penicillium canescens]|uniref:Uncharacterized protein n=1 Tax=Penicillium canescens TaxID=5083 RepID=A0AAD6ICD4_PENCN|nr:hypothetical protein N7522_000516 [Penicillium canescens]KAJ6039101.1 hypothetical protein N7460_007133 [Penicillium canescens]KAJ6059882.1 hypothetical protein N7444_003521 [Penicillium canescens]
METDKFDKFVASNVRGKTWQPSTPRQIDEAAIKTTRRLFRRYTTTHDEDDWEEYKSTRNQNGRVIKKALRTGFREFAKEAIS